VSLFFNREDAKTANFFFFEVLGVFAVHSCVRTTRRIPSFFNREDAKTANFFFFEVLGVFAVHLCVQIILWIPSFMRVTFQFNRNPRGHPLSFR